MLKPELHGVNETRLASYFTLPWGQGEKYIVNIYTENVDRRSRKLVNWFVFNLLKDIAGISGEQKIFSQVLFSE